MSRPLPLPLLVVRELETKQSGKTPFRPSRWHVRPANQDTVWPTKLPCYCFNCLEQSSSSLVLASISRGQFRAGLKTHLVNEAYTSLWERFVLRVNFLTYIFSIVEPVILQYYHTHRHRRRDRPMFIVRPIVILGGQDHKFLKIACNVCIPLQTMV